LRKTVSGIMLILLLIGMLALAFNVQSVKASVIIYIRADGSIDPPTAPISTADNVTYTFTHNIFGNSVAIERNSIVVDGAGYTFQGPGGGYIGSGFYSHGTKNVTIEYTNIRGFNFGIHLDSASDSSICGNNITNNFSGIYLSYSLSNSISDNTIMTTSDFGICLISSSSNTIYRNNITRNGGGIVLDESSNNRISGNNITANTADGIGLWDLSYNDTISGNNIQNNGDGISSFGWSFPNKIFHNNFINNKMQVDVTEPGAWGALNVWDDGYPSGGNYWSDYAGVDFYSGPYQNETGIDGIGDKPYVIDTNNKDRYPFMNPRPSEHNIALSKIVLSKTVVGQGYSLKINVTAASQGDYEETFVTVYANTTTISQIKVTLTSGNSKTITFTWNTSGFAKGNYTIWAYATPVKGETYTADNTFIGGWVIVSIVGDVTGPKGWPDGRVDMISDIRAIVKVFGVVYPNPRYNPNCDINGDGKIDMINDILAAAKNFGKTDP
jgi:parallel beta-helix repeat protein